jgi:hypothetical protein
LRHLTPPEGISHEEWWLAIRLARGAAMQRIPLQDTSGRRFAYAAPPAVQRLLHFVDRHCSGEIAMTEVVSDEQARRHYLVNSLMEEAIRSSQLEGATTDCRVWLRELYTTPNNSTRLELVVVRLHSG